MKLTDRLGKIVTQPVYRFAAHRMQSDRGTVVYQGDRQFWLDTVDDMDERAVGRLESRLEVVPAICYLALFVLWSELAFPVLNTGSVGSVVALGVLGTLGICVFLALSYCDTNVEVTLADDA